MRIKVIVFWLFTLLFLAGCGTGSPGETPSAINSTVSPVSTSPPSPHPNTPIIPPAPEPATPVASPQPGSTVGGPFLPGEVLAGLPVYPGAVPATYLDPGFGPPSFPTEMSMYGAKSPGYQSASAQYTVQATDSDILGWYLAELGAKGYLHEGEDDAGNGTVTSRSIAFYLPSQPLVSVQVHVYIFPDSSSMPVFELLVVYTVPLLRPAEEALPGDINSIQIDYAPGTENEVVKTITDPQTITDLVSLFNNLPGRPDYLTTGGPIGIPQTLYKMVFHSVSGGNITVTDTLTQGIQMDGYPGLDDPHNLFQDKIKQALGIPGASG